MPTIKGILIEKVKGGVLQYKVRYVGGDPADAWVLAAVVDDAMIQTFERAKAKKRGHDDGAEPAPKHPRVTTPAVEEAPSPKLDMKAQVFDLLKNTELEQITKKKVRTHTEAAEFSAVSQAVANGVCPLLHRCGDYWKSD